jgi:hypothetical protein
MSNRTKCILFTSVVMHACESGPSSASLSEAPLTALPSARCSAARGDEVPLGAVAADAASRSARSSNERRYVTRSPAQAAGSNRAGHSCRRSHNRMRQSCVQGDEPSLAFKGHLPNCSHGLLVSQSRCLFHSRHGCRPEPWHHAEATSFHRHVNLPARMPLWQRTPATSAGRRPHRLPRRRRWASHPFQAQRFLHRPRCSAGVPASRAAALPPRHQKAVAAAAAARDPGCAVAAATSRQARSW